MRESGYYWVMCTDVACCPSVKPEPAYYDANDPDFPWMIIFCEEKHSENSFRAIESLKCFTEAQVIT